MPSPYTYQQDLLSHSPYSENGIASRTIQNNDQFRVVQFAFAAGKGLSGHTAPHPVTLTFLAGQAQVRAGEDWMPAQPGTFLALPANLEHEIRAETEVVMLLTMLKSSS